MNHAELKSLQTRRAELDAEYRSVLQKVQDGQNSANEIKRRLRAVDRAIDALKNECGDFIVTEHAIVRFIERVIGMDMEELKNTIAPESVRAQIKQLGGKGRFPVNGSHTLLVKGGAVTTVVTKEGQGE